MIDSLDDVIKTGRVMQVWETCLIAVLQFTFISRLKARMSIHTGSATSLHTKDEVMLQEAQILELCLHLQALCACVPGSKASVESHQLSHFQYTQHSVGCKWRESS